MYRFVNYYIAIDRYIVIFNTPGNTEFGVAKEIVYLCAIPGAIVE